MTRPALIRKTLSDLRVAPNLDAGAAKAFSWDWARSQLRGMPGGALNLAFEAVDRHASGSLRERTAFRFLAAGGNPETSISYGELSRLSNRFCAQLTTLDRIVAYVQARQS